MERTARRLCCDLQLFLDLGRTWIVSGRSVCAGEISQARYRDGTPGRGRAHRRRGAVLRDTLGGARLEHEGDRAVQGSGSRVSRSMEARAPDRRIPASAGTASWKIEI